MAKRPTAILKWEPPVEVKILKKGDQVSMIQLPDSRKMTFSNEWLQFEGEASKERDVTEEVKGIVESQPNNPTTDAAKGTEKMEEKKEPEAAPAGRHGKVPVIVNGSHYDSVRKAFEKLNLPQKFKSKVRRSLRTTGKAELKYEEEMFKFERDV